MSGTVETGKPVVEAATGAGPALVALGLCAAAAAEAAERATEPGKRLGLAGFGMWMKGEPGGFVEDQAGGGALVWSDREKAAALAIEAAKFLGKDVEVVRVWIERA